MPHAKRLQGVVKQMNRVADEASANRVKAEDVLAQIEDREDRRNARLTRARALDG